MSDQMKSLLKEKLDMIRAALLGHIELEDWLDDPQISDLRRSPRGQFIDAVYAFGYIRGAAEFADLTIGEALEVYSLP